MLNLMRRSAGSWGIRIILSVIVLVFIFWGVGTFKSGRFSNIAIVNNSPISFEEYNRVYNDLLTQYKGTYESDVITEDMIKHLKIFTINSLIDQKLLLQQAVDLGFYVTDIELINYIQQNKSFLNDGVFDIIQYKTVLTNLGLSPNQFERDTKNFLLTEKLIRMLYSNINVSDLEIYNWYYWYNTLISLSYVFFASNNYKDIIYDSEEVCGYFERYKQNYTISSMTKIRYVMFDPNDYLGRMSIDKNDIIHYYNSHQNIFNKEKTVNVSHILVKSTLDLDIGKQTKAEEKINEIAKKLKQGANFAELAKLYSDCPSGETGGKLGEITYNSVVELFAKKAFSMSAGDVSLPIKTQFGWHIIKVHFINEAINLSIDEAEDQIKKILKKANANIAAHNDAENLLENCFNRDDLVNSAKLHNIPFVETDWFDDKLGPIEFITKDSVQLALLVASMKVGQISDVQELDGRYCIIQVVDKIAPRIPSFEDIKTSVFVDFKAYKQKIEANNKATGFLETVKKGKSFADVAKLYGLELNYTDFFARGECFFNDKFKTDLPKEILVSIFKEGDITNKPVEDEQGFYVACLREKKEPTRTDFNKVKYGKDEILSFLISQKKASLLSKLSQKLRLKAKIKVKVDINSY